MGNMQAEALKGLYPSKKNQVMQRIHLQNLGLWLGSKGAFNESARSTVTTEIDLIVMVNCRLRSLRTSRRTLPDTSVTSKLVGKIVQEVFFISLYPVGGRKFCLRFNGGQYIYHRERIGRVYVTVIGTCR